MMREGIRAAIVFVVSILGLALIVAGLSARGQAPARANQEVITGGGG